MCCSTSALAPEKVSIEEKAQQMKDKAQLLFKYDERVIENPPGVCSTRERRSCHVKYWGLCGADEATELCMRVSMNLYAQLLKHNIKKQDMPIVAFCTVDGVTSLQMVAAKV